MGRKAKTVPEVFSQDILVLGEDDCWPCRRTFANGYGELSFCGRTWRAHRWVVWILFQEEPETVLHSCDNPRCCNPKHLICGTQLENMQDKARKGRTNSSEAARRRSSLSEDSVREIRQLLSAGEFTQTDIALLFDISRSVIQGIKNGSSYRWVQ